MPDDPKPDPKDDPKPDPDAGAKKALEEERKARREAEKQLSDLQAKLKALDDAKKSDADKLEERIKAAEDKAAEAEKRVAAAERNALRLAVASEKKLSPAQAKRLVGDTREELEADADDLLESFKSNGDDPPSPKTKPRERLRGGSDPTDEPQEMNPAKLADAVPRL